jgi:CelD/BcsL family acetyltransferase involved in cellulose biosynthesis
LIILCYDEKTLIGIAPLMVFHDRYKGIPYKRIGFIEDANAASMNFISRQGDEKRVIESFLDCFLQKLGDVWHVAVLNKIPSASKTVEILQNFAKQSNINILLRGGLNSPYISTTSNWESFLKSTSVRFRKQLRNKINKLEKAGNVEFEVWGDCGVHGEHLEEAMSVSTRSWKQAGQTTMCGTPERKKFFELLSDVASKNGWLRIWLLKLSGKAIATEYHLEYKRRTHAMRGDFDQSQDALSPGSVLEAHIIEDCFKNGLLEYDFCGRPYGYKMQWTSLLHESRNVLFYNSRPYSRGLHVIQKYLPIMKSKFLLYKRIFSNRRSNHTDQ